MRLPKLSKLLGKKTKNDLEVWENVLRERFKNSPTPENKEVLENFIAKKQAGEIGEGKFPFESKEQIESKIDESLKTDPEAAYRSLKDSIDYIPSNFQYSSEFSQKASKLPFYENLPQKKFITGVDDEEYAKLGDILYERYYQNPSAQTKHDYLWWADEAEKRKNASNIKDDITQTLDLNPKKAAAIAAATTAGLSLMPEEAQASPTTAAKKAALELFHATRGAFEGDKLKAGSDKLIHFGSKEQAASRFDELLKQNKVSSGAQTIPVLADIKNPVELSDLNDWSANKIFRDMKKRGIINEQQAQEIVDKSRATGKQWGNDIDKDTLFDYMQNKLGYDAIKYKNIFEASEADKILAASKINPEMAKIPDLRAQKASLEAQLLDETGNTKPSSRETDKIHDQINKLDKQLRPLQNKLQSTFEQGAEYSYAVPEKHGGILKSKFSGTPLAIGGTAIGAGALASSSSAQAATDGSILQSNPEFSSSKSSAVVKKAVSEEQEKSKLLKALESYGTGARSAVSSATLGISEPVVSGLSAAVGSLIEAGFDAKDAVEFIKKASEVERFKKNYEEDVAYRKKMQEEHPIADISGSLVGAFSPVGPAAGVTKLTEKAVRSAIPAIKTAQEAKGLKATATRIGGNILEGAISTPIVTGAENITKGLVGNKEESNPLEDSLMGGTFGGVLSGAMEAGKAIGGRKVAGALGALGLAAGLSSDNAKAKEQATSDLTENEKNELRWRSIMRQINKSSSSL